MIGWVDDDIARQVRDIGRARALWLDETLADLLASGIARERIEVQEHPEHRVAVAVDGVVHAEWQVHLA